MKNIHEILIRPLVTEKSSNDLAQNKYYFLVNPDATKIDIRNAIEHLYKVKVAAVNTLRVKGKKRTQGRIIGSTSNKKKAIVTLKEGQLDLTQNTKGS